VRLDVVGQSRLALLHLGDAVGALDVAAGALGGLGVDAELELAARSA